MTARTYHVSLALSAALLVLLRATPAAAQPVYRLDGQTWTPTVQVEPDSPEGKLLLIRRLIAQDKPREAIRLADQWVKDHPNHPMLVEAYLLRGDAKAARGDYYNALFDYELLIRSSPGSEQFATALQREYEIARLFAGLDGKPYKRSFLGLRFLSLFGEAEELFVRIQERAPGSDLGERASLALGDHYFQQSEMDSAATAYELFLDNYPRSVHREYVLLRLIQSNLATFKGPRFDQTGLIEARQRLEGFQEEFPASAQRIGSEALLVRIEESLASKSYELGRWYEQRGEPRASAYLYRRVVRDHAQTAASTASRERLTSLGVAAVDPAMGEPVRRELPRSTLADEPGSSQPAQEGPDLDASLGEVGVEPVGVTGGGGGR